MTTLAKRPMLIIATLLTFMLGGCAASSNYPDYSYDSDYGPDYGYDYGLDDGAYLFDGCAACGAGWDGHWHHPHMPPHPVGAHGFGFGGHGMGHPGGFGGRGGAFGGGHTEGFGGGFHGGGFGGGFHGGGFGGGLPRGGGGGR